MGRSVRYIVDLHAADAAERLSRISLGLINGNFAFHQDGQRVVCHPGRIVRFGLRAEEGRDTGNLVIELVWQRPLEIAVVEDDK